MQRLAVDQACISSITHLSLLERPDHALHFCGDAGDEASSATIPVKRPEMGSRGKNRDRDQDWTTCHDFQYGLSVITRLLLDRQSPENYRKVWGEEVKRGKEPCVILMLSVFLSRCSIDALATSFPSLAMSLPAVRGLPLLLPEACLRCWQFPESLSAMSRKARSHSQAMYIYSLL